MAIKKENGKYKLDLRPDGVKGKRVIRLFDTKSLALQYQNKILSGKAENQAVQAQGEGLRLSELIEKWYELHGRSLKSSVDTKNRLKKLSEHLGNPIASTISTTTIADYRKTRLDAGISAATLNRELITLKAVFRELHRLSVIGYESSVLKIRKIRETKTELSYLSLDQVVVLQKAIEASKNESLKHVVLICLATGARWSEAENLKHNNCINSGFQFVDTKNGKNRFVPVDRQIFGQVTAFLERQAFKSCYSAFRSAFTRSGLQSPAGQLAHILRHTFASHFVMNGGNLVALQKILGHSSLNVTMRYSHLAPDYLKQVVDLNPIAKIQSGKKVETETLGTKKNCLEKHLTG